MTAPLHIGTMAFDRARFLEDMETGSELLKWRDLAWHTIRSLEDSYTGEIGENSVIMEGEKPESMHLWRALLKSAMAESESFKTGDAVLIKTMQPAQGLALALSDYLKLPENSDMRAQLLSREAACLAAQRVVGRKGQDASRG